MEACYYSLIRRTKDGRLVAWIPDRLGVAASSIGEDEIVREHPRRAPKLSQSMVIKALPLPAPSVVDGRCEPPRIDLDIWTSELTEPPSTRLAMHSDIGVDVPHV